MWSHTPCVGRGEETHYASWVRATTFGLDSLCCGSSTHQDLRVAGVDDGVTAHGWSGYEHDRIILLRHLQADNTKGETLHKTYTVPTSCALSALSPMTAALF